MDKPDSEDVLGLSDEDFSKLSAPAVVEEEAPTQEPTPTEEVVEPTVELTEAEKAAAEVDKEEEEEEESTSENDSDKEEEDDSKVLASAPPDASKNPPALEDPGKKKDDPAPVTKEQEEAAPDYKALYEEIMAPFKANGKMIDLKDPKELKQLAQMGANFTRKMQEMAPHRKMLAMIQNSNLDEDALSFLIDVRNKNPEAIKKLIKDSGIDPMDIDVSTEPAYKSGTHRVSDAEVNFISVLEDLKGTDEGKQTLVAVNSSWDDQSKQMLAENPSILTTIHEQRISGVYDKIQTEVERQRLLGNIPPSTSFLNAYKAVGDYLVANNAFSDETVTPTSDVRTPTPAAPVAKRVVAPKATVVNNDKASAASPSRATPQAAKAVINYLDMSDDDFLKQMHKRV